MSVGLDLKKSKMDAKKKSEWILIQRRVKVGEKFNLSDISLGRKGRTVKSYEKQFISSGWAFDANSNEAKELIAEAAKKEKQVKKPANPS